MMCWCLFASLMSSSLTCPSSSFVSLLSLHAFRCSTLWDEWTLLSSCLPKDSLRGRHLHLSLLQGNNDVSVGEAGPVSSESEKLNERGDLKDEDVQRERKGEEVPVGTEETQNEEAVRSSKEESKWLEDKKEREQTIASDKVSDEYGESIKKDKDEGDSLSENVKLSQKHESCEREEKGSNKNSAEWQHEETKDDSETNGAVGNVESMEKQESEEFIDSVVEESFINDHDGASEDEDKDERDELERSIIDESEEEKVELEGEKEEEDGESNVAVERCSLSQRELSQSIAEVEGGETEVGGAQLDEEKDATKPQNAVESDSEVVEVFENATTQGGSDQLCEMTSLTYSKTLDQEGKKLAGKMKTKSHLFVEVGFGVASVRAPPLVHQLTSNRGPGPNSACSFQNPAPLP